MPLDTAKFACDFAEGITQADSRRPRWGNYQPGIGPHTEVQTVALVSAELSRGDPDTYGSLRHGVPYPNSVRQKCDMLIDPDVGEPWAIEVKMLRLLGDNGKLNDNMLMHILSPYPKHRSALTDCLKLSRSGFAARLAILIYGFAYDDWPLEPAVEAFEQLARSRVKFGERKAAPFDRLIHPVHQRGFVFTWEIPACEAS